MCCKWKTGRRNSSWCYILWKNLGDLSLKGRRGGGAREEIRGKVQVSRVLCPHSKNPKFKFLNLNLLGSFLDFFLLMNRLNVVMSRKSEQILIYKSEFRQFGTWRFFLLLVIEFIICLNRQPLPFIWLIVPIVPSWGWSPKMQRFGIWSTDQFSLRFFFFIKQLLSARFICYQLN